MTTRPRRPRRRGDRRLRWRAGWLAVALIATSITGASVAGALAQSMSLEPEPAIATVTVTDFTIVSGARVLSDDEIAAAGITDTDRGRSLIATHVRDTRGATTTTRGYAAYDFGAVSAVLDVATPFTVFAGSNELGQEVQEVVPRALLDGVADVVSPGNPAEPVWRYLDDASASIYAGDCWKRVMWWTLTGAKVGADDLTPDAAFRAYGRALASPRAGTLCDGSVGFRRAWIEFSPSLGSTGLADYEPAQPQHHIGGGGDPAILSVGFGPIYATDLGTPPSRADGSANLGYGGVIDQRWAAWRKMGGEEPASGGVRWCLFFDHPTPPAVSFATRVSASVSATDPPASLDIRSGQDAGWEDCPPPD